MSGDVDLLRELLLTLERLQRSPPEPVFVACGELAQRLGRAEAEIEAHLERLANLDFIEGPGAHGDGFWLFRKLTQRGAALAGAIRDERDWRDVKGAYVDYG
jgi:hypothetical protein